MIKKLFMSIKKPKKSRIDEIYGKKSASAKRELIWLEQRIFMKRFNALLFETNNRTRNKNRKNLKGMSDEGSIKKKHQPNIKNIFPWLKKSFDQMPTNFTVDRAVVIEKVPK